MERRHLARLVFASLLAATVMACQSGLPFAPFPGASQLPSRASAARDVVAGTYALAFLDNSLDTVTSLIVSQQELILGARVTDAAGSPATQGSVTFEYCSYKGLPPNDITRADEAPSIACATGAGAWERMLSIAVNSSGEAYMNFGLVMIPRTVGFRIRYSPQGGSIASGTSPVYDFTWVAAGN